MSKQQLQSSQQDLQVPETTSVQQQSGATNSEQQQKVRDALYKANYEQALGDALGGALYDVVSDLITMDQMVRYGKDLADSLLDAAVKAASESSGANLNSDAQEKISGGLESLLDPLVEQMIRSETGTELVGKLQNSVGSNPYAVAGAGILAAAVAVLTDMDIPTLTPKLKLGGGFTADAAIDVGSLRNIALGATKVGLSYKREDVRAGIAITRSKEGEFGGSISGQIGNQERHIKGSVELSEEGITAFQIGGAIGLSNQTSLSGSVNGTDPTQIPNWKMQIQSKQGDFTHTGDLNYNASTQDLQAKYSGKSESMLYYANLTSTTDSGAMTPFKKFESGVRYTPQQGDVYSLDYGYNFQDESHNMDLVAQKRLGDFSVRGHQNLQYDDSRGMRSNTELMGAYHIGNDLALLGGADIGHNFNSGDTSVKAKAGIQYKDVPIVLSYDPATKSTSVGITLKF